MQSPNIVDKNIESIGQLFPNCIMEAKNENGKIEQTIDFDLLRQELSKNIVESNKERYQFTWPDKKNAILLANSPIEKTLRPCREESVDFDNTKNLYIEGDNLDVLKLLQETYLNKVKMIYIDPPYNTGNDFVYEDNFAKSTNEYLENSGQYDEDGNRLFQNNERNGRFHTDWLNMIYPRLKVSKDLLTEDGVIFISIDDNEVANLRKICDEIFGENNFIAQLIWERAYSPKNDAKYISNSHDYILMYTKQISEFIIGRLERTKEANARYSNYDNDPRGIWQSDNLTVKTYNEANDYIITTPSGRIVEPPAGRCWRLSKKSFFERLQDNRIWFGADGNGVPRIKRFLNELKFDGMAPTSILFHKEVGHSQEGTQEVSKLLQAGAFDGPKPIRLINRLIRLANTKKDSIILDFFSGSASTAHAVMKLNAEDGGHRKFIMVQVPEETDEKSEAFKAGYKNICEIGKERIRRAGNKIVEELEEKRKDKKLFDKEDNYKLDTGFRVLKLDTTNMKDVYYDPSKYTPDLFSSLTDNIKEDRTSEDLLFQVMLELGVPLSYKITETTVNQKRVLNVNNNYLIACFDDNITDETVTYIAKLRPQYVVFRDSSMASDSVATNFEQLFKTYSPETVRKVL